MKTASAPNAFSPQCRGAADLLRPGTGQAAGPPAHGPPAGTNFREAASTHIDRKGTTLVTADSTPPRYARVPATMGHESWSGKSGHTATVGAVQGRGTSEAKAPHVEGGGGD